MFNKNSRFMIVMLLILSLALVACGDDEDEDGGDNGGGSAAELTETFTGDIDGVTLTFQHPSGWVATSDDATGTYVASSEEFRAEFQNAPPGVPVEAEGTGFTFQTIPGAGEDPTATIDEFRELFAEAVAIGDAGDFGAGGFDNAAKASLTSPDDSGSGAMYVFSSDQATVIVLSLFNADNAEATVDAIMETLAIPAGDDAGDAEDMEDDMEESEDGGDDANTEEEGEGEEGSEE